MAGENTAKFFGTNDLLRYSFDLGSTEQSKPGMTRIKNCVSKPATKHIFFVKFPGHSVSVVRIKETNKLKASTICI